MRLETSKLVILVSIFPSRASVKLARNNAPNNRVRFEICRLVADDTPMVKRECAPSSAPSPPSVLILMNLFRQIVSSGGLLLHLDNKCATGYRGLRRGSVNNSQLAKIDACYMGGKYAPERGVLGTQLEIRSPTAAAALSREIPWISWRLAYWTLPS